MGQLGFSEMLVIFIVALLVFGPKKLPELGKSLGKGIREFKKATEADTRNRAAHGNLGAIYLQYRNYPNAVVELEAAMARRPHALDRVQCGAAGIDARGIGRDRRVVVAAERVVVGRSRVKYGSRDSPVSLRRR